MKKFLWRVYLGIVKLIVKGIKSIVKRRGDNFDLWDFGWALLEIVDNFPSKDIPEAWIVLDWLNDIGLLYIDEAVHDEAAKIKRIYELDPNMDIDEVDEEIIEEYFRTRD